MDNNNETYWKAQDERIERFLKNQMDEQEEKAFKENLRSDAVLAERAKSMAVLIRSMKKVGEEQDKRIINSVLHPMSAKRRLIPLWTRTLALAASVLLIIGVSDFFLARNNTLKLADTYMAFAPQVTDVEGAFRGTEDDKAVLNELTPMLDKIANDEVSEEVVSKLTGMFEKATSSTVNAYTDFTDVIGYNLAIAHLKNNERTAAKQVLERVLDVYPDYEAARKLLNEIEQIKGLW